MTVGQRLKEAIDRWGEGVMAFRDEMEERLKPRGIPGYTYPAIKRYLKDEAEPSLDFLKEAAQVLGVRLPWLAAGDGEMTEEEEREKDRAFVQQATLAAMSGKKGDLILGDIFRVVPDVPTVEELNQRVTDALGIQEDYPTWASALIEIGQQVGGASRADLVESWDTIGEALRGPLDAFGVTAAELEENKRLSSYILSMVSPLLIVAAESRRKEDRNGEA